METSANPKSGDVSSFLHDNMYYIVAVVLVLIVLYYYFYHYNKPSDKSEKEMVKPDEADKSKSE